MFAYIYGHTQNHKIFYLIQPGEKIDGQFIKFPIREVQSQNIMQTAHFDTKKKQEREPEVPHEYIHLMWLIFFVLFTLLFPLLSLYREER